MNYPQSQQILEEINKADKILLNLHRGPDLDSFSCASSMYYFLCSLGKKVEIVLTATSEVSKQIAGIEESKLVKQVNYAKFDFSKYDLFITTDSGSWQQIVDNPDVKLPTIPIVVVDHHASNEKYGKINLIDADAVSCAQVVYLLFKDWDFFIDTQMANLLLMGIISDSGGFQFSNDAKAMEIAGELMEKGANKEKIINEIFRTQSFEQIKAWGEFLSRMQIDRDHKFVWSAISYKDYQTLKIPPKASSMVATQFSSIVEGTNFGIIMNEDEEKSLKVSFRSRSDIDVAKLAEELGGGGHKKAAGGIVEGVKFEDAVEKVLETARKYVKGN